MSFRLFKIFVVAFIAMGFTAMLSQIVLIRVLIVLFTGNELTIGLILGIWLLWTAFGSGIFGRLVTYSQQPVRLFIIIQILLALLLPLASIFISLSRIIFNIQTGEILHPIYIILIPLIALAPICTLTGFLYTLGCKLLKKFSASILKIPGRLYYLEAIGSGISGFIASILLFRFFENYQIIIVISSINLMIAFLLYISQSNLSQKRIEIILFLISLTLLLFFTDINKAAQKRSWRKIEFLKSKTTIYGNIAATRFGESINIYENGVLLFTHPDEMYAEESVHFALLEHPHPEKILLIGGNAGGNLPQILKHPSVQLVDFVLLDPGLIELSQQFIPEIKDILNQSSVHIHFEDGRKFVKQTNSRYDVIIINLPPPQTTLINRFFTLEFFHEARKKLNTSGLISFSVPSSDNVIGDEQAELLSCLYYTMKLVFNEITLIPGYSIHFIATQERNMLTNDPKILSDRIMARHLQTKFIRDYYINYRLTPNRIDYLKNRIEKHPSRIINHDFYPIGYFLNIYYWLTLFNKKLIGTISDYIPIYKGIILFTIFILVLILLAKAYLDHKRKKSLTAIIFPIILIVGCTSISLEVLIIHGFQAIYGYAYYQLSLIMCGFMIGLAIGSWYGLRYSVSIEKIYRQFLKYQFSLILYPLFIFFTLLVLSKILLPQLIIQLIFLLLISFLGFIGGHQFSVANELVLKNNAKVERVGGTIYAWDLLGSVIGAVVISTLLIPFFGVGYSCIIFSLLNMVSVFMILIRKKFN